MNSTELKEQFHSFVAKILESKVASVATRRSWTVNPADPTLVSEWKGATAVSAMGPIYPHKVPNLIDEETGWVEPDLNPFYYQILMEEMFGVVRLTVDAWEVVTDEPNPDLLDQEPTYTSCRISDARAFHLEAMYTDHKWSSGTLEYSNEDTFQFIKSICTHDFVPAQDMEEHYADLCSEDYDVPFYC